MTKRRRFNVPARICGSDSGGFGMIEVLIAVVVSAVGLLGMAGLAVAVASHTQMAGEHTDQALGAQEVLERFQQVPFAAVTTRTDTVRQGSRVYLLQSTVSLVRPGLKNVQVDVSNMDGSRMRSYRTRVYMTQQLPQP